MRILLLQAPHYCYPIGDVPRINRTWMEALAAAGHQCTALTTAITVRSAALVARVAAEQEGRPGGAGLAPGEGRVEFGWNGVTVVALTEQVTAESVDRCIAERSPELIIVSEDRNHLLVERAVRSGVPTVWIVQGVGSLPFGPHAYRHCPRTAALAREVTGLYAISDYLRDYLRDQIGVVAGLIRPPLPSPPPGQASPARRGGYVTMLNPARIKGIALFTALARRLPDVSFGAVPGWATTEDDLAEVRRRPNGTVLRPSTDLAATLAHSSVVVVPSVCPEGFGLVAPEAMQYGLPVLAADAGGLGEAMLGAEYVLPVRASSGFAPVRDASGYPIPLIPEQDEVVEEWARTLRRLLDDPDEYARVAEAGRAAARRYRENTPASGLSRIIAAPVVA